MDAQPTVQQTAAAQPAAQVGMVEKFLRAIEAQPWSMIQLYMAGLIGVAFILQYGVMVLHYSLRSG
jgi:hypothetical protein